MALVDRASATTTCFAVHATHAREAKYQKKSRGALVIVPRLRTHMRGHPEAPTSRRSQRGAAKKQVAAELGMTDAINIGQIDEYNSYGRCGCS